MQNKYKGWIEGFGSVVTDQLGKETKQKILNQCSLCRQISNDKEMSRCVKEVMDKFDQVVPDKDKRYGVMESMGNYCFNNFFAKLAEDIKKKSNGIEEIIQNLNNLTGTEHYKLEGNRIHVSLNQCLCQIGVKETVEPISMTYCSCSLGWMKSMFNLLLDKT
ncbi:MAG: hypothetical protein ACFFBE_13360, partial [Promethearchaeota archaeon]